MLSRQTDAVSTNLHLLALISHATTYKFSDITSEIRRCCCWLAHGSRRANFNLRTHGAVRTVCFSAADVEHPHTLDAGRVCRYLAAL